MCWKCMAYKVCGECYEACRRCHSCFQHADYVLNEHTRGDSLTEFDDELEGVFSTSLIPQILTREQTLYCHSLLQLMVGFFRKYAIIPNIWPSARPLKLQRPLRRHFFNMQGCLTVSFS